ncbi:F(420)H(2) dehydrogenase subunit N [Methanosarcina sp.]|uniref:F(420)H(2) dehydrogenase subunit N n=1 Tax=Methanosarcina sp. TaxID=2213 RepID=UPI0029889FDD|nr:F(420)H(2) dehydrogenase subunit N [Methanosarcina sp.]MDW5551104.1 F(420)H(2) dehydrogenase subunit N [Methanosarcina sp.]MDW5552865.1 F(420)H(2) dehydrogenase subunit N [Methanosarcina sp.]MDW5558120.1 F(420)H(2) dehydrogenase subunit N [Methanosarcina sp.]
MENLMFLAPEIAVAATGLIILLIGVFLSPRTKNVLGYLATLGVLAALVLTVRSFGTEATMFSGTVSIDALSQFFKLVFLVVSLIVSLASIKYNENSDHTEEFYTLVLFATLGMMVVASSNDFILLFCAFELASFATYALAGFEKQNPGSLEGAMKYFVIGAVSSALMLFGISFVYGATGTTSIPMIAENVSLLAESPIGIVAVVLLIAGFGFKMALVPFHMWAPDAYQGSPSVVSSLLAAGSKKMGFVAAFRVFILALAALQPDWQFAFTILAVVTMTFGNVVAVSQTSVKRMLAYSSLAQAGYIAMAFAVMTPMALTGGIFYTLAHAFMKGGAFIAAAAVVWMITTQKTGDLQVPDHLDNFRGLGKRMPLAALCMMVFVFALAGIPLTSGFMAKVVLFSSAVQAGMTWLAVIAILNSALSLFYYVRLVRYMYFLPPEGKKIGLPFPYAAALLLAAAGVLVMGLWPEPFLQWAMEAAKVLI